MKKLSKIRFVYAFLAFIFLATLSSCGKIDDQTNASVTIKMPDLSSNSLQSVSAQMNSSVSTPTLLSDINCYAVMVGGPSGEPDLNRTRCEIVSVSSTVGASGSKIVVENRYVGMIRGLVPSNGTISLEVPAGSDRVFSLIGLKASPITSCLGFTDPNVNLDLVSDPILLGTTAGVNLTGGVTNNVTIQMQSASGSIANNYQIGECYGPDNPGSSRIVPTRAILTKNSFPTNTLVANQCNSIDLEFVDNAGRVGEIPVSAVVRLSHDIRDVSGTIAAGGGQAHDLYNSFAECSSNVNMTDYLQISAKSRTRQIWLKTVSETAMFYDLDPHVTTSATLVATDILDGIEKTFNNNSSSSLALEIFGTQKVLPDVCYKMSANLKYLNYQLASGTSYRYKVEHNSIFSSLLDNGASLYPAGEFDDQCLNLTALPHNSISSVSAPVASSAKAYFFIKYSSSGLAYRKTSFSLTPVVSGVSTTSLIKSDYQVEVIEGSRNPSRIAVMGPNQIPSTGAADVVCPSSRVYRAIVVNEKWTALPASATITLATSLKSGSGSLAIINASSNNPCPSSTTAVSGTTSLTLNQYSMGFFVKPLGATNGSVYTVTATAVASGPLNIPYTLPASTFDIYVGP